MDYQEWAEKLLEELYYAPEDHRISILSEHLTKVHWRGYEDGKENGWAIEQDRQCRLEEGLQRHIKRNKIAAGKRLGLPNCS